MFTVLTLLQFHGPNIVVLASFLHGLFIAFIHRHLRARGDSSIFYLNGCAAFGSFPNYAVFLVVASIMSFVLNVIMHPYMHQIIAIIPDYFGKPRD